MIIRDLLYLTYLIQLQLMLLLFNIPEKDVEMLFSFILHYIIKGPKISYLLSVDKSPSIEFAISDHSNKNQISRNQNYSFSMPLEIYVEIVVHQEGGE